MWEKEKIIIRIFNKVPEHFCGKNTSDTIYYSKQSTVFSCVLKYDWRGSLKYYNSGTGCTLCASSCTESMMRFQYLLICKFKIESRMICPGEYIWSAL